MGCVGTLLDHARSGLVAEAGHVGIKNGMDVDVDFLTIGVVFLDVGTVGNPVEDAT